MTDHEATSPSSNPFAKTDSGSTNTVAYSLQEPAVEVFTQYHVGSSGETVMLSPFSPVLH